MEEQVRKVLRCQGDIIHPLDVSPRRKIARTPGSLTVYHTTRLCERLIQPKSEFDLSDPRGFLMNSEYNCLHDPNLRGYLYRKDIHQRLLRGGFITKDDKVICSLKSLNKYRDHVADVDKNWSCRFRMEQKEVVRTFLTLQEQGRISNEVTVSDVTDWILRSRKGLFVNPNHAFKSRSMPGLRLQQLPAIAKRCSAIEVSAKRSEMMWTAKGTQMMEEVTKEVQREMRLERRWVVGKMEKEKKREQRLQGKLKKAKKTTPKSKKLSPERLSSQDGRLLPEEVEKRIGGQGEPSQSMDVPAASPKGTSPRRDLATKQHERKEDLGLDVSPPHSNLDHIFALTPDGRVRSTRQNSPDRNISLIKQHPFSDAKKKLSAICQNLIIRPPCSPRPASACGIIHGKMISAEQISSHLVDLEQSLLENHFKGVVTSEELQVVLREMVVTLIEEVNKVLIPAIVAFEHERVLTINSPKDLPCDYDTSSSTMKISPVTSSSVCSTPEVRVTYPDYALPTSRGPSRVELWSLSSPEDGLDNDRHSLGKKVVAPTASLLLKVESLIKDIIKDSMEVFTVQMDQVNAMASVTIGTDREGKTKETKPEEKRDIGVSAERHHMDSPETTDTSTTDATALSSDATDASAVVISDTTTAVTMDTIASTREKTAVVTMDTTTAVTMETTGTTDETAVVTMNTATANTMDTATAVTMDMETTGTTDETAVVTLNTTTPVTVDTRISRMDMTAVVTMNTATVVTMDTIATTEKPAVDMMNTTTAVTMETIVTTDNTAINNLNTIPLVTTEATFVDTGSVKHLVEPCDGIKDTEQQLGAKDAVNDNQEFGESEASHMTEDKDMDKGNADSSKYAFVVSLEKSIQLSSDQVDEILEKVACILEEEQPYLWFPSDMLTPEDGHVASTEPAVPLPNCVIFAIIQKMQLDKYLERKLMSFFAGRHMAGQESVSLSPNASSLHGAQESLSWSSLSEINPYSIKVTKWLLQTIQRRNCWQGNMTSDPEAMDLRQMREKHLICEVIHTLLDHLNNVSTTRSISRQTQSETNVCSLEPKAGPVCVGTMASQTSLAASELTKDVMSKLVLEDNLSVGE